MKKLLIYLLLFVASFQINAQTPPWYFINTSVELTHVVLVLPSVEITVDGNPMQVGDYIGAFYQFSDTVLCATGTGQTGDVGGMMITGQVNAATLWGAEPNVFNGFQVGEFIKWKVWRASDGSIFDAEAVYDTSIPNIPDSMYFAYNGISKLYSLSSFSIPGINISVNKQFTPNSACLLSENEAVEVLLENHDSLEITNFPIYLSINGGDTLMEFITDTIPPHSTMNYTFSNTFDLSQEGSYKFNIWVYLEDDVNNTNDYNFKTVIHKEKPEPYIGNDTIMCVGDSMYFYPAESYAAYQWNTGSWWYYTVGYDPGWYVVTVYDEEGCAGVDSLYLDHYQKPEILLADSIIYCNGGSSAVYLAQRFREFHWSNGIQTPWFYMTSPGTYYVSITDYAGCNWVDSITGVEIPEPIPVLGENITTALIDTVVIDAGPGYDSYLWSTGEVTQSIQPLDFGFYEVTVTIGECEGSNSIVVIREPVDPNPQNLIYEIQGNLASSAVGILYFKKDPATLILYNEIGQQIQSYELIEYKNFINVEALKSGVYYLRIQYLNEVFIEPIVKL